MSIAGACYQHPRNIPLAPLPNYQNRVPHRAFAGGVGGVVHDLSADHHSGRAAAVEVETLINPERSHEVRELGERHAGTRLTASVDGDQIQGQAVAREADGRTRVSRSGESWKGALEPVGAVREAATVVEDAWPPSDQRAQAATLWLERCDDAQRRAASEGRAHAAQDVGGDPRARECRLARVQNKPSTSARRARQAIDQRVTGLVG